MRLRRSLLAALLLGLLAGCAQYDNQRGVMRAMQPAQLDGFTVGQTSRQDVLSRLGPPSQVIALGDETVLYYLFERSRGEGLILVVYNRFTVDTRYDRAIFFFDANDRLTEMASHIEADAQP